jgi:hypothetical protein
MNPLVDLPVREYIRSMRRVALTFGILLLARVAHGQSASIRGTVRDSSSRPMVNADVVVQPTGRRARTDSAGRFAIDSLEAKQFTVRARRVGYAPTEWTIDLSKGGRADIQLTLGPRIAALDTVFVFDGRPCDAQRYEGFMCRRATTKGRFIDYADIDSMDVLYSADLLRDVGGFSTVVRPTRIGPTRVGSAAHCTIVLLNGVSTAWSSIPESPFDIIGIEVYQTPKEIPREYQRYTWGKESCWLVAYWTANFLDPVRKQALPRP